MIFTAFSDLPLFVYDFVMADPPWAFALRSERGEAKSAQAHYECWSMDRIKALPVADLCKPDALLWLWATNPMLDQQIDCLKAWGFSFVTSGHWAKTTKHGKQAFGTGYVLRGAGEPFLIGRIGRPKTARDVRSVIIAQAGRHSEKPDAAFAAAERLLPSATRRLELFSRRARPGWDVMGDQIQQHTEGGRNTAAR
ncbi:DNA methyltransferase [Jannaschia pagri]|uniref:DNA methyltransferase n=1 Tax=Jannaschia pagri TaxID=2829797 RepID=A0ABQ4NHV2_9RHOB|nr:MULTISPECIES: MT-A70 family methyltransferase [unclassified Jannaschia]GIT90129.1 DNA methyltransferase [Jannaschia sp. AI_61]GIT93765.1 DNA methyltransferase [Jannaschia sp. AI_62]